uniref:Uncharacterized protein n=1 Tax=Knipowitschia caucasica TaxID=637954 RepID=A0AAV2LT99_KNICA
MLSRAVRPSPSSSSENGARREEPLWPRTSAPLCRCATRLTLGSSGIIAMCPFSCGELNHIQPIAKQRAMTGRFRGTAPCYELR